ncbi:hypothetical protein GCM10028792_13270 [Salinisphaera aquimarina]
MAIRVFEAKIVEELNELGPGAIFRFLIDEESQFLERLGTKDHLVAAGSENT